MPPRSLEICHFFMPSPADCHAEGFLGPWRPLTFLAILSCPYGVLAFFLQQMTIKLPQGIGEESRPLKTAP